MAEKNKILMIDDERDIAFSFAMTFQSYPDIYFFSSNSAEEGIRIAKKEKPNLIMLDLRMPRMNGEEALIELKKFLPQTKFMVMTGWEDGETKERIEQIGVDAYYSKPIDLEQTIAMIMKLLNEKG